MFSGIENLTRSRAFSVHRRKIFFVPWCLMFNKILRKFSSGKMTTRGVKWQIEKEKILTLPLDEKRKLYTVKQYFTLDQITPWGVHVTKFPNIEGKERSPEDITEFKRITIDPSKSKLLTEKVSLFKGDITGLEIDAIVNAANSRLKAGGGVDGAIHKGAGPLLQAECDSLQGCPTGEAKITGGYNLPAKYIIHTVGPQDSSEQKLQACYENSFNVLKQNNLKSIAFPCISTGIYGYPNRKAAHVALRTARKALEADDSISSVIFCTFLNVDVEIYETLMHLYFPIPGVSNTV